MTSSLDYILLWDVIDRTFDKTQQIALKEASEWPGYPKNPIDPNSTYPINEKLGVQNYAPFYGKHIPEPGLYGRDTSRVIRGGYASLSNYNVLP